VGEKIPLGEGGFIDVRPIWADVIAVALALLREGRATAASGGTWPDRVVSARGLNGPRATAGRRCRCACGEVFRLEYGRIVAVVVRIVRDIDVAEEIAQEAFGQALRHWPTTGLLTVRCLAPDDRATAALDHLRRVRRAGTHAPALAYEAALDAIEEGPTRWTKRRSPTTGSADLHLLPSRCLPEEESVSPWTPGWLEDSRRARSLIAFLVREPTIAQRLVRPSGTIRDRGLFTSIPEEAELSERLSGRARGRLSDLQRGYAAHAGDALVRQTSARKRSGSAVRSPS
jgi:RNA polymerase sigma-70 factor (ECF subfamily)